MKRRRLDSDSIWADTDIEDGEKKLWPFDREETFLLFVIAIVFLFMALLDYSSRP